MKKLVSTSLLLLSINLFSQDTISTKKFALGGGPTWGSVNWCGNANLSYAVSKKFNVKLRGIYSSGKDYIFTNQPYSASIQNRPTTNVSVSANYFIFGNTNQNCKAALYIGLGLGYLQQTSNTTNLYQGNLYSSSNSNTSYIEKDVSKGLAANTSIGAAFKLGPGKLFVEAYFSMSFLGKTTYTDTFMNQVTSPVNLPQLQVNKYKEDFEPEAILCFNAGYIIPF